MPETKFERVPASHPPLANDEHLRNALSDYVIAAVPGFYSLIPLAPDSLRAIVGAQIGLAGTELQEAVMAMAGTEPAGLVTWLPSERLDAARRATSVGLMRHVDRSDLPKFMAALTQYGQTVEPFDGTGMYLSRVAVSTAHRGIGLGRAAVQQVIDAADGGDVWLHVADDNKPAIALYQAMGFEFLGSGDYGSRAMRRPGGA